MRILYVGSLYPEGYVSTTRMRMEELLRLGLDIVPLDAFPYYLWGGKWIGAPFRRLQWGPPLWLFNQEIVRQAQVNRPDVLWIDKGVWVYRKTLRAVRSLGTRMLIHHTPDPAIVSQRSCHFVASIPEYNLIVTTKAYELPHYRRYGASRLLLQYPSYDRDVHQPHVPTPDEATQYAADVVFAGSYACGREKFLRPLAQAGIDLVIWGNGWNRCKDPVLQRCLRRRPLGGRDFALGLSCAKIGLGTLSPLHPDRSTTRSLEIPACGTFLLAERTEEHQALFEEGKEAVFFSSEDELVTKAHYYLAHDDERRRIAAAGRARCLSSGYSSADRVKEILSYLHKLMSRRTANSQSSS